MFCPKTSTIRTKKRTKYQAMKTKKSSIETEQKRILQFHNPWLIPGRETLPRCPFLFPKKSANLRGSMLRISPNHLAEVEGLGKGKIPLHDLRLACRTRTTRTTPTPSVLTPAKVFIYSARNKLEKLNLNLYFHGLYDIPVMILRT